MEENMKKGKLCDKIMFECEECGSDSYYEEFEEEELIICNDCGHIHIC